MQPNVNKVQYVKHIKVPTNPNFIIVPMFEKNFLRRMLNPDGKMMSGEWKLPKMNTIMKTIRLNPDDDIDNTCIQIRMGAKQAINSLLKPV